MLHACLRIRAGQAWAHILENELADAIQERVMRNDHEWVPNPVLPHAPWTLCLRARRDHGIASAAKSCRVNRMKHSEFDLTAVRMQRRRAALENDFYSSSRRKRAIENKVLVRSVLTEGS